MDNTTLIITITIGISAAIAVAANTLAAARGSLRRSKDYPGLYEIPNRWATIGAPAIASLATLLSATAGIASLLML